MFHGRLRFILICNVTIEAIFRSSPVVKRIDKISLYIDIIQSVGCKRKQGVGEKEKKLVIYLRTTMCATVHY